MGELSKTSSTSYASWETLETVFWKLIKFLRHWVSPNFWTSRRSAFTRVISIVNFPQIFNNSVLLWHSRSACSGVSTLSLQKRQSRYGTDDCAFDHCLMQAFFLVQIVQWLSSGLSLSISLSLRPTPHRLIHVPFHSITLQVHIS